jgi:hypothetical protein
MYSFVVPHKAFAAGDDIPVLVKFQPMAKGVSVQSITSTIKEYTSIRWRGLQHQETRTVASAQHEVHNGRAVLVGHPDTTQTPSNPASAHPGIRSRSGSYMNMLNGHGRTASGSGSGHANSDVIGHAISRLHSVASAVGSTAPADAHDAQPVASSSRLGGDVESPMEIDQEVGDDEVDTSMHLVLPLSTSPSSTIEVST